MILFLGTAALSGGTLFEGFVRGDVGPVLGAACYLCAVTCTIGGNVPLNNALARIPEDDDAVWRAFARPWARLNLVRMVLAATGGSS
jgi:uncharacterized membrane protein